MSDAEQVEPDGRAASAGAGETKKASRLQRGVHVLAAVVVCGVVPAVVIGELVGEFGVAAMLMGLLLGGIGAKIGGTQRMLYVAPAVGLAAGLGAFSAYGWWWVALLALCGFVAGAGIGFGWLPTLLMLPYAATFPAALSSGRNAATYGVIVAIATLYGVLLVRRFGVPEMVESECRSPLQAIGVAVVFGVGLGASAALGVGLGWSEPYWVAEPILILLLYIIMGKGDRVRGKAIGTACGVAAAVAVAAIGPSTTVTSIIAAAAFLLALSQAKTYWLMYGLYTFALVLALSAPGQIGAEAEKRGVEILTGIGLLVIGLAIVHSLARWQAKRHPQPELA